MEESLYDTSVIIDAVRKGVGELKGYTLIFNVIELPKAYRTERFKGALPNFKGLR